MQLNTRKRVKRLYHRISLVLKTTQAITIPPGRQEYPYCKIEGEIETFKYTTGVVEPQQNHKSAKATTKYSIGHALTTLDGEGGCHVMLTNTDDEARNIPKGSGNSTVHNHEHKRLCGNQTNTSSGSNLPHASYTTDSRKSKGVSSSLRTLRKNKKQRTDQKSKT